MKFEKAIPNDSAELMALYRTSLADPFSVWTENYPAQENIDEDLELDNLFVLREAGAIIGAISLCPHDEETDSLECWTDRSGSHVEFARVCVLPSFHGRGLALTLVEKIEEEARRRGHSSVRLLVAEVNIPAYKTYIKAGYHMIGECDMYGSHYICGEKYL